MRYCVVYTERQIREIIVEADSEEEAERMVMDGEVDYDESSGIDVEIVNIDSSEYLDG